MFRSGFACFVGRPNAGKSTLTNALIGQKVAITSSRPQTTRHAIRGILHRRDAQLVVIDTPGLHKPRTLLGSRLNDVVRETWAEVDAIGFCVPADVPVDGDGDDDTAFSAFGDDAAAFQPLNPDDVRSYLHKAVDFISDLSAFAIRLPSGTGIPPSLNWMRRNSPLPGTPS